jgi:hypothetical protein
MLTLYYAWFFYRNRNVFKTSGFKLKWFPIRLEAPSSPKNQIDGRVLYDKLKLKSRGFFRFIDLSFGEIFLENESYILFIN